MNRIKSALLHQAFGTEFTARTNLDPNKPLSIPFGQDSYQLIGLISPEAAREQLISLFPDQTAPTIVIPDNPANDPKFAERDIDLIRGVRQKELEDYRRQLELKGEVMIGGND